MIHNKVLKLFILLLFINLVSACTSTLPFEKAAVLEVCTGGSCDKSQSAYSNKQILTAVHKLLKENEGTIRHRG